MAIVLSFFRPDRDQAKYGTGTFQLLGRMSVAICTANDRREVAMINCSTIVLTIDECNVLAQLFADEIP